MAINTTFDVNLLDFKALDKLTDYYDMMPHLIDVALDNALHEIAERVKARMLTELMNYGLGDSSLASSIFIDVWGDGISIRVDSDHAVYVEFGTGVKGAGAPHNNPSFLGKPFAYASGPQSSKGTWWYEIDYGYAKAHGIEPAEGKDGRWYAKTSGMESRPFIYNSYLYARRIVTKTVNKHLKRVL